MRTELAQAQNAKRGLFDRRFHPQQGAHIRSAARRILKTSTMSVVRVADGFHHFGIVYIVYTRIEFELKEELKSVIQEFGQQNRPLLSSPFSPRDKYRITSE